MTDYDVFIPDLGRWVEIQTKDKEHIFGLVKIVGDTAMRLEPVHNPNQNGVEKIYKGQGEDLYDVVSRSAWGYMVLNYKDICELKPLYSKEEKISIQKKRGILPDDAE